LIVSVVIVRSLSMWARLVRDAGAFYMGDRSWRQKGDITWPPPRSAARNRG
jgi:hypothetical protein